MSRVKHALPTVLALSIACHAAEVRGDDVLERKQACVAASDRGQTLRDEGRLRRAEAEFIACVRADCPAVVRDACAGWLDGVRGRIPSVVIVVRDAAGRDVVPDRVVVDGVDARGAARGRSLDLDPGEHEVAVEGDGQRQLARFVLHEAERGRVVEVVIGPAPALAPGPAPAPAPAPGSVLVPVLAGVGVALLGTSVVLGLDARAEAARLRQDCAPRCTDAAVDPVRQELLWGEVALVGAVLSLGAATWLHFGVGERPESHVSAGVLWGPRGATATLQARF